MPKKSKEVAEWEGDDEQQQQQQQTGNVNVKDYGCMLHYSLIIIAT